MNPAKHGPILNPFGERNRTLGEDAALAALQGFCANPELRDTPYPALVSDAWNVAEAFLDHRRVLKPRDADAAELAAEQAGSAEEEAPAGGPCEWIREEGGTMTIECGAIWKKNVPAPDALRLFRFCPFCRRRIELKQ